MVKCAPFEVVEDQASNGHLFPELDAQTAALLKEAGTVQGGMIPKVEAALWACRQHAKGMVKIAPAQGENAILHALTPGVGTMFLDGKGAQPDG